MDESKFLEFMEEDRYVLGCGKYIISYPARRQGNMVWLRLWVAYDIGNRAEYYCEDKPYEPVPRGFYLYISQLEMAGSDRLEKTIKEKRHERVFLIRVTKKTKAGYRDASRKAGMYAREIVENLYEDLEVEWNEGIATGWTGEGSGAPRNDKYPIIYYNYYTGTAAS